MYNLAYENQALWPGIRAIRTNCIPTLVLEDLPILILYIYIINPKFNLDL